MRKALSLALCLTLVFAGFPFSALAAERSAFVPIAGRGALPKAMPLAALPIPRLSDQRSVAPLAAAPAAREQLALAKAALAAPQGGAQPSAAEARSAGDMVWSGARQRHADFSDSENAIVASNPPGAALAATGLSSSRSARAPKLAALLGAVAVPQALAAAAPQAGNRLPPLLEAAAPYAEFAALLGVTYAAHRIARYLVDRLAKRGGWDPNATDTARFVATMSTWSLGVGVGMHLAGASAAALVSTFGVALTLAVKKTVVNMLQAVVFLVNRPFYVGEKMRIGDRLYQVDDMQLQYVKMKVLGKLIADKPETVPAGMRVVAFKDVDPLGRDADEKGHRFLLARTTPPGPQPQAAAQETARFKYTALAAGAITLFRPYDPLHRLPMTLAEAKARLTIPTLPLRQFVDALKESPRQALLKAAVWMALSMALVPALPFLKLHVLASLLPYVQGAAIFWATKQAANFADKFVPLLAEKLAWSHQALVIVKLLAQIGVYAIGLPAGLRAAGLEWNSVMASLGVPAIVIGFATSELFTNFCQALQLRADRPFRVGETLNVGSDFGLVQEMNNFYVVLKVADGSHTLVPYSVIDGAELNTYEPAAVEPSEPPHTPP